MIEEKTQQQQKQHTNNSTTKLKLKKQQQQQKKKMIINNWEKFENESNLIFENTRNNKKTIEPFPLLSLVDDPEIHLINSRNYFWDTKTDSDVLFI